jgi:2-oxoglutarate ferredoxin oxidoreductase subunit alpha
MVERIFSSGNEAIARGAIQAGCRYFFGYPITPQNAIPEFMSAELPKMGGAFVQAECEGAAINMLYGASATGARAMTSTSSPGISLMGEGISSMAACELPGVVVDVARMGPGWGTVQNGQTDYRLVTKAGGHSGIRNIVLAPASVQEAFDLMQLAFHLADKYRILVIVLSDYVVGEMAEPLEIRTLEFEPPAEKDWTTRGKGEKGGRRNTIIPAPGPRGVPEYHRQATEKYDRIQAAEIRSETDRVEDADLLVVAYGSSARVSLGAIDRARVEGIRAGLFRPITLWPFPLEELRQKALRAGKVLVVEDSQGQLVEDVDFALRGQVPVHLLGVWGRDIGSSEGLIHPERVLAEIRSLQ